MTFAKVGFSLVTILLLTLVTQVGGIIYLLCYPGFAWISTQTAHSFRRICWQAALFCFVYILCSLILVPPLAALLGRVPMPMAVHKGKPVKPLNLLTCLLNRHYVRKPLRDAIYSTASQLHQRFPGTVTLYLDANFPFWNGFPLIPHLSHYDGKKIDVAFFYCHPQTGAPLMDSPSWLGYGFCEGARPGEINRPRECEKQGYWTYNFMAKWVNQHSTTMAFDAERTKTLVQFLAENPHVQRIFIEPHLKIRLGLTSYRAIGYHGCQAVRHDDHIHIQIK